MTTLKITHHQNHACSSQKQHKPFQKHSNLQRDFQGDKNQTFANIRPESIFTNERSQCTWVPARLRIARLDKWKQAHKTCSAVTPLSQASKAVPSSAQRTCAVRWVPAFGHATQTSPQYSTAPLEGGTNHHKLLQAAQLEVLAWCPLALLCHLFVTDVGPEVPVPLPYPSLAPVLSCFPEVEQGSWPLVSLESGQSLREEEGMGLEAPPGGKALIGNNPCARLRKRRMCVQDNPCARGTDQWAPFTHIPTRYPRRLWPHVTNAHGRTEPPVGKIGDC